MRLRTELLVLGAMCIGVGSLSFAAKRHWDRRPARTGSIVFSRPAADAYVPRNRRVQGAQLVLVYFGKASCAWSNQPEVPPIVEAAKLALRRRADSLGVGFITVGVALDWSPTSGLQHLTKLGLFDEVAAGGNWSNSLAQRYIWGKGIAGPAATPQLLVLGRYVETDTLGSFEENVILLEERQLQRASGIAEMGEWKRRGFPTPRAKELLKGTEIARGM